MNKKKLTFRRIEDYKGYNIEAWECEQPNNGDHLIEIYKDSELLRAFVWPSYKIYNLQAHFEDIVEGEIADSTKGYEAAAWNGLSGAVVLVPESLKPQQ